MSESHRPEASPGTAEFFPKAPLTAMRSDTLARVEKAVLDLFSSRDFHEVSLHDVARSANVSLQTIYKYFGSKEALVYSMLDIMLGRLAERMIDHLQGIDDARERLRKTCWVTLDYMDKHPAVMLLMFTAVPVSRHKNIGIYESPELMSAFLVAGQGIHPRHPAAVDGSSGHHGGLSDQGPGSIHRPIRAGQDCQRGHALVAQGSV
jgi:AcrR family transcriptional regulator